MSKSVESVSQAMFHAEPWITNPGREGVKPQYSGCVAVAPRQNWEERQRKWNAVSQRLILLLQGDKREEFEMAYKWVCDQGKESHGGMMRALARDLRHDDQMAKRLLRWAKPTDSFFVKWERLRQLCKQTIA